VVVVPMVAVQVATTVEVVPPVTIVGGSWPTCTCRPRRAVPSGCPSVTGVVADAAVGSGPT
jgi:hypothetical protein